MRRVKNRGETPVYPSDQNFKSPSTDKSYVKILQYVADNDGCTRAEILVGIGRYKTIEQARTEGRGQWSHIFAKLLYKNWLDYDEDKRYHITSDGEDVLECAYLNGMERIVKGN